MKPVIILIILPFLIAGAIFGYDGLWKMLSDIKGLPADYRRFKKRKEIQSRQQQKPPGKD